MNRYQRAVEAALAEVGQPPPQWDDEDGFPVAYPPMVYSDAAPEVAAVFVRYVDDLERAVNLADPLWAFG